jgi:hypothetical protein
MSRNKSIRPIDVKKWIEGEMAESYDYRPDPGTVKVMRDPRVHETFAARFKWNGETVDLLFITGHCPNADDPNDPASVLEAVLEEVEFDTWPPVSGDLRFFA